MIQDFIINGVATSGKDTFIDLIKKQNPELEIYNISSIDPFRELPLFLGWNGIDKSDDYRKCLVYLKQAASCFNFPFKYMMKKRQKLYTKKSLFFYHIREPEEINNFIKEVFFPVATILIKRETMRIPDNTSDLRVNEIKYNVVIDNNSSLNDLEIKAFKFIKDVKDETI